jgi:acetate kinase
MILNDIDGFVFKIDAEKNKIKGKEAFISTDDSKIKVMVVPTNEELAIARETMKILNQKSMEN